MGLGGRRVRGRASLPRSPPPPLVPCYHPLVRIQAWSSASGRPGLASTGLESTPEACGVPLRPSCSRVERLLLERGGQCSTMGTGTDSHTHPSGLGFLQGSAKRPFCLETSAGFQPASSQTCISLLVSSGPRTLFSPLPHPPGLLWSQVAFEGLCPDDSCKPAKPHREPSAFSSQLDVSRCHHQTTEEKWHQGHCCPGTVSAF